jgi:hypothetical protein
LNKIAQILSRWLIHSQLVHKRWILYINVSIQGTSPGADPGFQVRGGALKKNCAEWREARTFLRYFVWKITILRQKFIFFSNFRGARAPGAPPPWIRPCSLLLTVKSTHAATLLVADSVPLEWEQRIPTRFADCCRNYVLLWMSCHIELCTRGPSWSASHSCWIYKYLCNQCRSPLKWYLGEMYSIQHYVIKFVSDLRQVGGFLRVPRFLPLIKLTATI